MTEKNEEEFIQLIEREIRAGNGMVPLTGAGASARSGIMVGRDFDHYLSWIIYCCIGKPQGQNARARVVVMGEIEKKKVIHNLREDGWLARPSAQEIVELIDWVFGKFVEVAKQHCVGFVATEGSPKELRFSKNNEEAGPGHPVWSRPRVPRILDGPYQIQTEIKDQDKAIRRLLAGKSVDDYLYKLSDPNSRIDSEAGLQEVAIRVMFDWRAMLDFLTRVSMRNGRAVLSEERDESIVDGFHQFITRGRKPNLTHTMLAQLAGPLRTRVLFTTNFDSLHEEAFRSLKQPYERLSVSKAQGLPAVHTVRAATSIIKLHGSLTGTRADFSLDVPPPPEDCAKFFYYLMGRWHDNRLGVPEEPGYVPSHMLVIGASGSDIRILHFLKFLLDETRHETVAQPKIFWVCHDKPAAEKIRALFGGNEYQGRVIVTVTDRSDLLLLELYQATTLTLPKGGTSYHYAHDVPPQPWPETNKVTVGDIPKEEVNLRSVEVPWPRLQAVGSSHESPVATVLKCIRESTVAIKSALEGNDQPPAAAITVVTSKDGQTGLTPLITDVFEKVQSELRKEVLWIELEDFYDVPDAVHHLLHVAALRRGVFQLEHATLLPGRMVEKRTKIKVGQDSSIRVAALEKLWSEVFRGAQRYLGDVLGDYVVCFYGRNVPGSFAGWAEQGHLWEQRDYEELHIVFDLLSSHRLHVLYVPLTEERIHEDNAKIAKLGRAPASPNNKDNPILWVHQNHADTGFGERLKEGKWRERAICPQRQPGVRKSLVDELLKWEKALLQKDETARRAELRLLYAVSLFRQSRPPSVFWTDPLFPSSAEFRFNDRGIDSDWAKKRTVKAWLDNYRNAELMWRKPGGSSWMYRDGLLGLRLILEDPKRNWGEDLNFRRTKSRTHFWIARWYFRAFCSSNHVVPLLESFYHFYQCAIGLKEAKCPDVRKLTDENILFNERQYRAQRLVRVLTEWIKTMRIGRPALQFWLDRPASEGWLSGKLSSEKGSKTIIDEISSVIDAIGLTEPQRDYVKKLNEMLNLELERCRLSLKRGLYFMAETAPSVVHGEFADVTSVKIGKVKIFTPTPSDEVGLRNLWCPPCLGLRGEMAKAGQTMADAIVGMLMVQADESAAYLKLKGEALSHLTTTNDYNSKLPVALCILKERLYSLVRFAKSLDLAEALKADAADAQRKSGEDLQPKPLLSSRRGSRRYWRRVNILGRVIFDLCAFCPPALLRLDMNVRVSVLTLRALAHGRLGRFYQAHRRLNEAHAILTRVAPGAEESDHFAFIELRRAEVYLLEADQVARLAEILRTSKQKETPFDAVLKDGIVSDLFAVSVGPLSKEESDACDKLLLQFREVYALVEKQDHLPKLLAAKLDDAWAALEGAEHLLAGRTRAALSWGRLCNLKLRLFAHHKKTDLGGWDLLALRRRQEIKGELSKWVRLGFANWADDPYRQLRLAWYFVKARMNWADVEHDGRLFEISETSKRDLSVDDYDISVISTLVENWEYDKQDDEVLKRIEDFRNSFLTFIRAPDPTSRQSEDIRNALRALVWNDKETCWKGLSDSPPG